MIAANLQPGDVLQSVIALHGGGKTTRGRIVRVEDIIREVWRDEIDACIVIAMTERGERHAWHEMAEVRVTERCTISV